MWISAHSQMYSGSNRMKNSVDQLHTYQHASEAIIRWMRCASYLPLQSHFSFLSLVFSSCSLIIPEQSRWWGSEEQSLSEFHLHTNFSCFLGLIFYPLLSSQCLVNLFLLSWASASHLWAHSSPVGNILAWSGRFFEYNADFDQKCFLKHSVYSGETLFPLLWPNFSLGF